VEGGTVLRVTATPPPRSRRIGLDGRDDRRHVLHFEVLSAFQLAPVHLACVDVFHLESPRSLGCALAGDVAVGDVRLQSGFHRLEARLVPSCAAIQDENVRHAVVGNYGGSKQRVVATTGTRYQQSRAS
jgi:hypothetical protein